MSTIYTLIGLALLAAGLVGFCLGQIVEVRRQLREDYDQKRFSL